MCLVEILAGLLTLGRAESDIIVTANFMTFDIVVVAGCLFDAQVLHRGTQR